MTPIKVYHRKELSSSSSAATEGELCDKVRALYCFPMTRHSVKQREGLALEIVRSVQEFSQTDTLLQIRLRANSLILVKYIFLGISLRHSWCIYDNSKHYKAVLFKEDVPGHCRGLLAQCNHRGGQEMALPRRHGLLPRVCEWHLLF